MCHTTVSCDETFKSSSHLFETIVNPDTSFSGSPSKCPFSNSRDLIPHGDKTVQLDKDSGQQVGTADTHKSDPTIWDILTRPSADITCFGFENERLRRFGVAMEGVGKVLPVEEVLEGKDALIHKVKCIRANSTCIWRLRLCFALPWLCYRRCRWWCWICLTDPRTEIRKPESCSSR